MMIVKSFRVIDVATQEVVLETSYFHYFKEATGMDRIVRDPRYKQRCYEAVLQDGRVIDLNVPLAPPQPDRQEMSRAIKEKTYPEYDKQVALIPRDAGGYYVQRVRDIEA